MRRPDGGEGGRKACNYVARVGKTPTRPSVRVLDARNTRTCIMDTAPGRKPGDFDDPARTSGRDKTSSVRLATTMIVRPGLFGYDARIPDAIPLTREGGGGRGPRGRRLCEPRPRYIPGRYGRAVPRFRRKKFQATRIRRRCAPKKRTKTFIEFSTHVPGTRVVVAWTSGVPRQCVDFESPTIFSGWPKH